jgi:hypothetical protein
VSTGNSENVLVAQSNMVFNGTNLNITGGTFVTDSEGSLDSSAIVQFKSTTKGFLPPVMTTVQKNAIINPTSGLTVYDSTIEDLSVYTSSGWTGVITERDTLQIVTNRGNTTTNGITVGGLVVATNLIYTDLVNSRVGIGTTTPLGILHLKTTGATTRMVMDGDESQSKIITYRTNGLQRFGMYVNNTPESGSNNGSDFQIRAYSDAGTLLTTTLFIKRSTGNVAINTTTDNGFRLDVNGTTRFQGASTFTGSTTASTAVARGVLMSNTLVASADNNTLVGLDINPTFTNGTFTGVNNIALRVIGPGTGSTTTSLLVQNSGGTQYFKVADNGTINLGSSLTVTGNGGGVITGSVGGRMVISSQFDMAIFASGGGIGIGGTSFATNSSAMLEVQSITKGFLPPRMTTTQRNSISTPATGLTIYNTTTKTTDTYDGATWQQFGQQTFIKGSGTTSATSSLLVQNSTGNLCLSVNDGRSVEINNELVVKNTAFGGWLKINTGSNNIALVGYANGTGDHVFQTTSNFSAGNFRQTSNGFGFQIGALPTIDASALIDLTSTTKGFLRPRMTTSQRDLIATPATGLTIYNTTTKTTDTYDGTSWQKFGQQTFIKGSGTTSATSSLLVQNSDGTTSLNINDAANVQIGTTTDAGFRLDVNGTTRFQGASTFTGSTTASTAVARGVLMNNTLVASANNDTLVGLDINTTFTNGAFTGVTNIEARIQGTTNTNFFSTGNLGLNTATDAGFKLDVNGTTRIQGTTTLLNTLTIGTGVLNYETNANLNFTITGNQGIILNQSNGNNGQITLGSSTSGNLTVFITNQTKNGVAMSRPVTAISGTTNLQFNSLLINNVINFSAATNSIARGLYINPTLTSVPDFRAIETTAGKVIISGSVTSISAVTQGVLMSNTLVASANNTTLVGLDVNPTFTNGAFTGVNNIALRVIGPGTGSTTTSLLVQNSGGTTALRVTDAGNVLVNTNTDTGSYKVDVNGDIKCARFWGFSSEPFIANNGQWALEQANGMTNYRGTRPTVATGSSHNFTNLLSLINTTGAHNFVRLLYTFAPTSGTGINSALLITPTINQTGGANGITRGLYINPILTSAADFRAIETSVGNVIFGSTSGNVLIGTTTDAGYKLDVNGTARVQNSLTLGNLSGDPSGANGMIYYNTTTNKFRGYENGSWTNLI